MCVPLQMSRTSALNNFMDINQKQTNLPLFKLDRLTRYNLNYPAQPKTGKIQQSFFSKTFHMCLNKAKGFTRLFALFSVRSKFGGTNRTVGKAPLPVAEQFEHVAPLLFRRRQDSPAKQIIHQGWPDFFDLGPNLRTIFHSRAALLEISDDKVIISAKLKKIWSFLSFY